MSTQTNTFQRKVIAGASRQNELHRLFWIVEIRWPLSAISGGTSLEKEGRRYTNAQHPGRCVPVIPVGPDPIASRHYAEMLCGLFAANNVGRSMEFAPVLADIETLAAAPWYVYGEQLPAADIVCSDCGCINGCVCPPAPPQWALIGRNGARIHISRDMGTVGLCGRSVQAQWVTAQTARDRRAWPLTTMCSNCFKLYRKGQTK